MRKQLEKSLQILSRLHFAIRMPIYQERPAMNIIVNLVIIYHVINSLVSLSCIRHVTLNKPNKIKVVEWKRNVTAQAQKPDSVFQRNGRVHLYRRGCQFSRVLAFLECRSAENDCSNTGWTVPSQAEDCWLPTPFASFPFTSPPVRHRVPSDSVSTLPFWSVT